MRDSHQLPKLSLMPTLILLCISAFVGCRNAAYNDLYVENMAAEIRDLEDQLYEYDNEYHVLEQQLKALKAENQQLRLAPLQRQPPSQQISPQPQNLMNNPGGSSQLQFAPRDEPPPAKTRSSERAPQPAVESILELPESSTASPNLKLNEESLPAIPPKKVIEEVSPDLLDIPTIEPGIPMPPTLPTSKGFSVSGPKLPANDMELNLSRIEVPTQLASSQGQAQLKIAAEKPSDMRIIEITFHPALSRAANFDDEPDDDGLYLVLQPKNVSGQVVLTPANLDIAVLDPSREGDAARISRWSYTAAEVKAKIQPTGSNQGIHLTLPWNGPDPAADRVVVFVRYTFPDGRQVVNDKTLFTAGKGSMKTVWVPRNTDGSQVVAASFEQDRPTTPSNVVRPQPSFAEPAPNPDAR
jgi:hypothetical protein